MDYHCANGLLLCQWIITVVDGNKLKLLNKEKMHLSQVLGKGFEKKTPRPVSQN